MLIVICALMLFMLFFQGIIQSLNIVLVFIIFAVVVLILHFILKLFSVVENDDEFDQL